MVDQVSMYGRYMVDVWSTYARSSANVRYQMSMFARSMVDQMSMHGGRYMLDIDDQMSMYGRSNAGPHGLKYKSQHKENHTLMVLWYGLRISRASQSACIIHPTCRTYISIYTNTKTSKPVSNNGCRRRHPTAPFKNMVRALEKGLLAVSSNDTNTASVALIRFCLLYTSPSPRD